MSDNFAVEIRPVWGVSRTSDGKTFIITQINNNTFHLSPIMNREYTNVNFKNFGNTKHKNLDLMGLDFDEAQILLIQPNNH